MKDRRHTNHVTDTVATHRIRHVTPMCTLSNNGWLGPHESAPQTAFRSVQPSLQLSWLHTDTDQRSRNSNGVTPYGGTKCRWGGSKSVIFHK